MPGSGRTLSGIETADYGGSEGNLHRRRINVPDAGEYDLFVLSKGWRISDHTNSS